MGAAKLGRSWPGTRATTNARQGGLEPLPTASASGAWQTAKPAPRQTCAQCAKMASTSRKVSATTSAQTPQSLGSSLIYHFFSCPGFCNVLSFVLLLFYNLFFFPSPLFLPTSVAFVLQFKLNK